MGLISIVLVGIKILILFLLSLIPVNFIRNITSEILEEWKDFLYFEIVLMAPPLFIVLGAHCPPLMFFGVSKWLEKGNFGLIVAVPFLCIFFCVLLYLDRYNDACPAPKKI